MTQNLTIDINRDQVLDVQEIIDWLLLSRDDYSYHEMDEIFVEFDSNRDWHLDRQEIEAAYAHLLPLLPQSVWTDRSFLSASRSEPQLVSPRDELADVSLTEQDNSTHPARFLRAVPNALQRDSRGACDRRLPFVIPTPEVCDLAHVQSR